MRAALVLSLLFATGALAGCFQNDPEGPSVEAANASANVTVDESRPDPVFEGVTTGPAAAPDKVATLDAPPELQVGEWWRIRLDDPFTGTSTEFIRVLAAKQGETLVFGMPHEGWWKEAVVFHTPAFGDVNAADLSYNTHDILFTPLKFPLVDGDTWETAFSGGATMTANVERLDDQRAKITFTQSGGGFFGGVPVVGGGGGETTVLELTYDAAMHEVVEFAHQTVTFTVLEHGFDFEGWITVPRAEKLVFLHGRLGPALDLNLQPAAPVESVPIDGGFNRMSFITATQAIAPGATCRITATAPDGATYSSEETPCQSAIKIDFHEAKDPDGDWSLEHVAGGGGVTFIEGIAYHQYDIHLPSGDIRTDHSHEVIR